MVYSCKVPPLHPILWAEGRRLLRVPPPNPPSERTAVVYASRGKLGGDTANGARSIENENDMLEAIRGIISTENKYRVSVNLRPLEVSIYRIILSVSPGAGLLLFILTKVWVVAYTRDFFDLTEFFAKYF